MTEKAPLITPDGSTRLRPAQDVEGGGHAFLSLSEEPWLELELNSPVPAGRWVRLRYSAGWFAPLKRPIIRFINGQNHINDLLPAPLLGRGEWIGWIPESTETIWISPLDCRGSFTFRVDELTTVSAFVVFLTGLANNPRRAILATLTDAIGMPKAAQRHRRRSVAANRLKTYKAWRDRRVRPLDLIEMDKAELFRNAPHIRLVASATRSELLELQRLTSSLRAQPYPNWSLLVRVVDEPSVSVALCSSDLGLEPQPAKLGLIADATYNLSESDLIASIDLHSLIFDHTLSCIAEAARGSPNAEMLYADTELIEPDGVVRPALLPDWSPIFFSLRPYIQNCLFLRVAFARAVSLERENLPNLLDDDKRRQIVDLHPKVVHVRRILQRDTRRNLTHAVKAQMFPSETPPPGNLTSIIIPTRDRVDLLEPCINSILRLTNRENFEVLILDNDSANLETSRYLEKVQSDSRFRILPFGGAFNYAKLCNAGAEAARGQTLVFLNNDTEATHDDWLAGLLTWTRRQEVGAVGAKLIYPNGKIQHAGIVLGMDGRAGHIELKTDGANLGYFENLDVAHEVSAVTGACLAVEKAKFFSVGGFDAVNLPVDLNDVDLCLRLNEAGYATILEPRCVLIHQESATRRRTSNGEADYAGEWAYFLKRWMHRLRDDPYFHPALSLDSETPSLG